jgi:hypothetical protein
MCNIQWNQNDRDGGKGSGGWGGLGSLKKSKIGLGLLGWVEDGSGDWEKKMMRGYDLGFKLEIEKKGMGFQL